MAIFEGILDRIRTKKKEMVLSSHDAYYSLLKDVASAKEVDADEAAMVLDAAGKTENQFEADVQTMESRIGLAAQLKHKLTIEKQIPKLEHVERLAGEHYEKVVGEANERLNEAKRAKRAAEHELLMLSQVAVKLRESCLDETLLVRERELDVLRMEIHQKLRPLSDDVSRSRNLIKSHEHTVQALEKKSTDNDINPVVRAAYKEDLKEKERTLAHEQHIHGQLVRAIAELNEKLEPITTEFEEIAQRKLVP